MDATEGAVQRCRVRRNVSVEIGLMAVRWYQARM
jgi:hypothetical protein